MRRIGRIGDSRNAGTPGRCSFASVAVFERIDELLQREESHRVDQWQEALDYVAGFESGCDLIRDAGFHHYGYASLAGIAEFPAHFAPLLNYFGSRSSWWLSDVWDELKGSDIVPESTWWRQFESLLTAARFDGWRVDASALGARAEMSEHFEGNLGLFAGGLPVILEQPTWFLDSAGKEFSVEQVDFVVGWVASGHSTIRTVLKRLVSPQTTPLTRRARGILLRLDHATPSLWEGTDLAPNNESFSFPKRTSVPCRTWLGDPTGEEALTEGLRKSVGEATRKIVASGKSEEEGLTGMLLDRLDRGLGNLDPADTGLTISTRIVPKREEHHVGADVGIVVKIDVQNQLKATWGALVQVKKSNVLAGNPRPEKWKIDGTQLATLLKQTQASVYWLLGSDGVLVVPARFLAAMNEARGNVGEMTVSRSHVRNEAVPLEQFLVDLCIGGWTVTDRPSEIITIEGGSGTTAPFNVLEVSIRSQDG